ncbi:beta-ketoacyl-[acyl-carrier-protein] synthase family protein [Bacillus bombysepticus]|uniref:beta-ketoacyl-[acyl-carrier-protein] synthase family protein n=1 Tax=Bacillus bombysepticus TaxID=658666 RepID=UPI00207925EC|nr:beta-ketoacyl-[acyl-carrier-protein] synthase family protein [Bacillus bombysepticus]USL11090.1 beta-ketoacyl-[acyl-carrier-protein] synthase family protein [Bacillus bombysepticus]
MDKIVVTGIGTLNPAGIGAENTFKNVLKNTSYVDFITRFDASKYKSNVAGEIRDFIPTDYISKRLVKKTDRFTQLALAAVQMALDDAQINTENFDANRISLMVGNVLGGWEFAERELRNLWSKGEEYVSPYQATAWFPTSAQGYIAIAQGIKGKARTFVADRASSAYAVLDAVHTLNRDEADIILVGGTEAPLSPYGWLCCESSGYLSSDRSDPSRIYKPFSHEHNGMVLGEGSTFLVLEKMSHAQGRGAKIYGEIRGWGVTNDAYYPYYTQRPDGQKLAKAMKQSMNRAVVTPEDIDLLFLHGTGIPSEDATEIYAYREVFKEDNKPVLSCPKASFGHLLGAAAVTDIMLTLLSLQKNLIPPTINLEKPAYGFDDLDFVTEQPSRKNIDNAIVISRGMGGNNVSFVVGGDSS